MEVELSLQNGCVVRAGPELTGPVEARELYFLLADPSSRQLMSDAVGRLSISRRPLRLHYKAAMQGTRLGFEPVWKGVPLDEDEATKLGDLGYLIRDEKVYFIEDEGREELRTALQEAALAVALPLLRKLHAEGRLESSFAEITSELVNASKFSAHPGALFIRELYPYQRQGVDWLCFCVRHGIGTILADDMGLGKTAQLIATICDTIARDGAARILVVVPNPLIENWRREFGVFAPDIVPYIHHGAVRTGLAEDLLRHSVVITPYTTLASDISLFSEMHYRLVVFDEASMVKNAQSARARAAFSLQADSKITATGTPVENSLVDVWTIADLALPGYLGPLGEFNRRYVGKNAGESLGRDLGELEESLRSITLRRMKADVLEQLPEKRDIHYPVTMQPAERTAYEGVITELRSDAATGGQNMLALINRLQQFTSHPILLSGEADSSIEALCSASGKFELLLVLLDGIRASGEKVLIFATYQRMIDLIASAVEKRFGIVASVIDGRTPNTERQPIIDSFSTSPGFAVLVLHPRTAGMGFNITAATHVIHYSRQWNPALEMQATARAWRNGQTREVSAYYLFYAGTIEELVDERLRQKQMLSDAVVTVADEKEPDKHLVLNYLERFK